MTDLIADSDDNILFACFEDWSNLCDAMMMFWLTRTDIVSSESASEVCENFSYLSVLLWSLNRENILLSELN